MGSTAGATPDGGAHGDGNLGLVRRGAGLRDADGLVNNDGCGGEEWRWLVVLGWKFRVRGDAAQRRPKPNTHSIASPLLTSISTAFFSPVLQSPPENAGLSSIHPTGAAFLNPPLLSSLPELPCASPPPSPRSFPPCPSLLCLAVAIRAVCNLSPLRRRSHLAAAIASPAPPRAISDPSHYQRIAVAPLHQPVINYLLPPASFLQRRTTSCYRRLTQIQQSPQLPFAQSSDPIFSYC
ncbi:hypothetical protein M0R45_006407 [Rubus argutus]|uniref:Uncharacterized protein n=1 Tax=Rubus argutus TaxID=59490 RepID=A0AAW1YQE9_RUBAR